jgi:hypothetical protein
MRILASGRQKSNEFCSEALMPSRVGISIVYFFNMNYHYWFGFVSVHYLFRRFSPMKKILAVVVVCFILLPLAFAESLQDIQKELTRTGDINGATISFIILDDTMLEFLYGKDKDLIKSKLSSGTALWFKGKAGKKEVKMDKLYAFQNEQVINGSIINSKIVEGQPIPKGETFTGILQLEKKINLYDLFTIKGASGSITFRLTDMALRNIKN